MFLPTFEFRIVLNSVSSSWTGKFDFPYEKAKKKLPVRELFS